MVTFLTSEAHITSSVVIPADVLGEVGYCVEQHPQGAGPTGLTGRPFVRRRASR